MLKINCIDLKIDHIILFNQDTTFACCKENSQGRIRLFLILRDNRVYARNGRQERWEAVEGNEAGSIRNHIQQGTKEGVPVYRFNGSFHATTEQVILN